VNLKRRNRTRLLTKGRPSSNQAAVFQHILGHKENTWTAKPETEIYSADEDFSTFSPSHPLGPGRGAFLNFFICDRTLLPYSLLCQLNRPSYFTFRHPSGASSRGQICASSSRLARSTYLQYHKGTLLAHHFYITSKLQQLDCLQSNSSNSCRT